MPQRRRYQRPQSPIGFSYTPLIDVIFLLTIFFMLVSKFTSAEQVAMLLPEPEHSRAKVPQISDRIVVNCRVGESTEGGDAVLYSVGPNPPETIGAVSERLAAMKGESPDMKVVIRADRRIRYADVLAVMREVSRQHIEMLNVAAIAGEGE
jgi:biopolymer transport protein ExbD